MASIKYTPFGATRAAIGTIETEMKFTGQRLDSGVDLYYYGARNYDANIGRFISADNLVHSLRNPQSLNRYSYVYNNPLRYSDPTGNVPVAPPRDPPNIIIVVAPPSGSDDSGSNNLPVVIDYPQATAPASPGEIGASGTITVVPSLPVAPVAGVGTGPTTQTSVVVSSASNVSALQVSPSRNARGKPDDFSLRVAGAIVEVFVDLPVAALVIVSVARGIPIPWGAIETYEKFVAPAHAFAIWLMAGAPGWRE